MLEPETILSRAGRYLSAFTFKFWLGVCALLLAANGASYCKGVRNGKALQAATYADAEREAVERARKADEAARGAVDGTQGDVEAGNQRARDAAAGSDDPLRDGLKAIAAQGRQR